MTRERKPIDPELRRYLDSLPQYPSPAGISNEERARRARELMPSALRNRRSIEGLPNGVTTQDVSISDELSARLYTPSASSAPPATATGLRPVLVYFHGGGWVVGSVATHDPFCRLLTEKSGVLVLSVDYRLAPEHVFPAAVDDAIAAVKWATDRAREWGGDPSRISAGGDSAGANLAAAAINHLAARDFALAAQVLLFPVVDPTHPTHRSYEENATGYGLEASVMQWFLDTYAPGASVDDPRLSPFLTNPLPKLPPTLVVTAEYDPLRDDGVAYAEKLKAAGVAITWLHAQDMHHNFAVHPGTVMRFPQSRATLEDIASWLRATLLERT